MVDNANWRPKVGEKVQFTGVVTAVGVGDAPYHVEDARGLRRWFHEGELHPLPAAPKPRKPWEVLLEAMLLLPGYENRAIRLLHDTANRLEAAAALKVPTLQEAAEKLARCVDRCINVGTAPAPDGSTANALRALREALAREPGA